MNSEFVQLVSECDTLIKAGKISEASALLCEVNTQRVPRDFRQALAKLCRRSGLIELGLRLLYPVIRAEKKNDEPASAGEICEYAVLLSRNGSIGEALVLLEKVDSDILPEALLYRGFCYISSWSYDRAFPLLEKFLTTPADNYSKLIARVNLAASYVALGHFSSARLLLAETILIAQEVKATRLCGNCYELLGQTHVLEGNFDEARKALKKALEIFGEGQSYDQLLILKWQSVMQSIESGSTQALKEFRAQALERKHWESVRDADLFSLKVEFNQKNFDYLVVGTASPAYRVRIQQVLQNQPRSQCVLGDENSSVRLDLSQGSLNSSRGLNPGKKIHQVLVALTRDFYSSHNMGGLFAELYPDEFYNTESSPVRVRQLLSRTRKWLAAYNIPVSIEACDAGYRLSVQGPVAIEVPLLQGKVQSEMLRWQELNRHFSFGQNFTVQQACTYLKISSSSFHRWVEWAKDSQLLKVTGVGKSTRYQLLNANENQPSHSSPLAA